MTGRYVRPSFQYFDNSGNVLDSGQLFFFDSGTVVEKTVYADPDALIPLTQPIVLDGAGRTPNLYLDGSYKEIVKDKNNVQISERDPVLAADDTTKGFSSWNAVTTYSTNDIVRASDSELYISIINSNQNNDPTSTATAWTQTQLLDSYNANQTYSIGDIAVDSVGDIYKSLTNSNIGNTPSSSPSDWDFSTIGTAGIIEAVEANAVELGRDTPAAARATTLTTSGKILITNTANEMALDVDSSATNTAASRVDAPTTSFVSLIHNSHATGGGVFDLQYTAASPDNNSNLFLRGADTTTNRIFIWSDGDLANHDGVYGTISDRKLKTDFNPATSFTEQFRKLNYQTYRMKSDIEQYGADCDRRLGLVVDEVEQIFPSLVIFTPDMDGDRQIEIDGVPQQTGAVKSSIIEGPVMAIVLQEALDKIDELENRLKALEA